MNENFHNKDFARRHMAYYMAEYQKRNKKIP